MSEIKNDLLLRCLKGETVERPPVWMMRQAGRYLPDFIRLREKHSFFERVETPELATEITIMPVEQVGVDAAILFSDILVIPKAMGCPVDILPGKGPVLPEPIRKVSDIEKLHHPVVEEALGHVLKAITLTKEELAGRVPLIGFAGSPWTILCYMVEGGGSPNFNLPKQFCFTHPAEAQQLLQKITDVTIEYLQAKVRAGADVIQIFDSWGGLLSPADYRIFSLPYMKQIAKAIRDVPVILFAKGCQFALAELSETGATGLGIDWTTEPKEARRKAGEKIILQGNMDPSRLLSPIPDIVAGTRQMIREFGDQRYIANLGHGILPNVPVDHAKAFIDTVKSYETWK